MSPLDRRSWLKVTGATLAGTALVGTLPRTAPGTGPRSALAASPGAPGDPAHGPAFRQEATSGDPEAGAGEESVAGARGGSGVESDPGHPLTPRLEAILDDLAGRRGVHGALMHVVTGDGSFRWSGARGEASPGGPALRPDTPFFTASITKLFIAASVMRLVEEGELALHHRMTEYLPPERVRGLHVWEGVDRTGHITVEQLLAHASGLPDFIEDYPVRGSEDARTLVEILVEEGDRGWSLEDTVERVRGNLVPHFLPQPLGAQGAPPGGARGLRALLARRGPRIRYSDTGYQLLMALVEERTGTPFHEAVEALVLDPLGLEETWIPGHPRPGTPETPVAALWAGDQLLELPRFFQALGDLNATAPDLLAFMQGLEEGRLFRDPESWRRMTHPWRRFSHPLDRAALRQPSWPIEYGLGVMRFQLPPLFTRLRRLPAVRGHTGSTGTWLFHAPELDLYMVGAVNQVEAGALPYRTVPRILGEAVQHLPRVRGG